MTKTEKPKFPLCSKYGLEFVYGKDEDGLEKVYYEKDVELALSKAEAGTPHKLNSYSYKRGYEQGKLDLLDRLEKWMKHPEPMPYDMALILFIKKERLKSQLLITTNECQISSSQKEGENQDRGEKLFHELTYDKFKEIKKQGAK